MWCRSALKPGESEPETDDEMCDPEQPVVGDEKCPAGSGKPSPSSFAIIPRGLHLWVCVCVGALPVIISVLSRKFATSFLLRRAW